MLFARAARLGRVKTRLVPACGRRGALILHRALLADSRALVRRAGRLTGSRTFVAWSEGRACGPRTLRQGGGDLGARLRRVIRRLLRRGHRSVVVLGSDSPTLPAGRLEQAVRALDRGVDLVLGPARDGGYYLIGLRDDVPALFARMPWGRGTLCARTLARARRARMRVRLLDPWYDVDRPADLVRLRRDTAGGKRLRAPRTAAALERLAPRRPGDQPT